jgi:hypothetical protein
MYGDIVCICKICEVTIQMVEEEKSYSSEFVLKKFALLRKHICGMFFIVEKYRVSSFGFA